MTTNTATKKARLLRRLPPPEERRSIRERAGLSLNDLARVCSTTPQAVHGWENGRTPSLANLAAYVDLLDSLASLNEGGGDNDEGDAS